MTILGKTRQAVEDANAKIADATETAKQSINLSLILAGVALLVAVVAIVAVIVK